MIICEELRQAVLQAAIQGKLTKQSLEDGTSIDFLKRIAKEKGLNTNTPESLEVNENDVPFAIPANWSWTRIGNVILSFHTGPFGSMLHKDDYSDSGIPLVNPANITGKHIVNNTKTFVSQDAYKRLTQYILHQGDIVIGRRGEMGRCAIVSENQDGWLCGTGSFFMTVSENVCKEYIQQVLSGTYGRSYLQEHAIGTTMQNLNQQIITNMILPLPPLAEQYRIVKRVDELMSKIDALQKVEDELESLKKAFPGNMRDAILQSALQGKLTDQRPEDGTTKKLLDSLGVSYQPFSDVPYDIPSSWAWVSLNMIGEIVGGGTPKTSEPSYWDGDIPWLTPADMREWENKGRISRGARYITKTGLDSSSAKLMPAGTIVFSSRAPIGYIAISDCVLCTNQGFKSLVPKDMHMNTFLYFAILHRTEDIRTRASGTTFKEISGKGFGETLIPLPPLAEQHRIVDRLNELLPLCGALEQAQ